MELVAGPPSGRGCSHVAAGAAVRRVPVVVLGITGVRIVKGQDANAGTGSFNHLGRYCVCRGVVR